MTQVATQGRKDAPQWVTSYYLSHSYEGGLFTSYKKRKVRLKIICLTNSILLYPPLSMANGVRWYGHVLRKDDGHVLKKALEFEVKGKRKRERSKKTWKTQVEKESKSVGLEKEDAMNRARWRVGIGEIAGRVG